MWEESIGSLIRTLEHLRIKLKLKGFVKSFEETGLKPNKVQIFSCKWRCDLATVSHIFLLICLQISFLNSSSNKVYSTQKKKKKRKKKKEEEEEEEERKKARKRKSNNEHLYEDLWNCFLPSCLTVKCFMENIFSILSCLFYYKIWSNLKIFSINYKIFL